MRPDLDCKFQEIVMPDMSLPKGGLAILAGGVLFDARFATLVATGAALLNAGRDHGFADLAGLCLRHRKA